MPGQTDPVTSVEKDDTVGQLRELINITADCDPTAGRERQSARG